MRNARQQNSPITAYFIHHIRVLLGSLGRLTRHPLSSMMTMAVIAIALTLPSGLYLALNNISGLSEGWDSSTQISLFLNTSVSEKKAQTLVNRLRLHNEIDHIEMISKNQLPKKLIISTHPHRWFNFGFLWFVELILQNIKNVVKVILIRVRR